MNKRCWHTWVQVPYSMGVLLYHCARCGCYGYALVDEIGRDVFPLLFLGGVVYAS